MNLRKSRAVLGDTPNETGFLLDFGHGFTSCVAFQLHQPGGAELNSVDILSEHSIDVGYAKNICDNFSISALKIRILCEHWNLTCRNMPVISVGTPTLCTLL